MKLRDKVILMTYLILHVLMGMGLLSIFVLVTQGLQQWETFDTNQIKQLVTINTLGLVLMWFYVMQPIYSKSWRTLKGEEDES